MEITTLCCHSAQGTTSLSIVKDLEPSAFWKRLPQRSHGWIGTHLPHLMDHGIPWDTCWALHNWDLRRLFGDVANFGPNRYVSPDIPQIFIRSVDPSSLEGCNVNPGLMIHKSGLLTVTGRWWKNASGNWFRSSTSTISCTASEYFVRLCVCSNYDRLSTRVLTYCLTLSSITNK